MRLVPNVSSDQAFWRTSQELRALVDQLRAELGASAGSAIREVEAIQASLEHEVRTRRSRVGYGPSLPKAAGFP